MGKYHAYRASPPQLPPNAIGCIKSFHDFLAYRPFNFSTSSTHKIHRLDVLMFHFDTCKFTVVVPCLLSNHAVVAFYLFHTINKQGELPAPTDNKDNNTFTSII
jgi:hypothetical protein